MHRDHRKAINEYNIRPFRQGVYTLLEILEDVCDGHNVVGTVYTEANSFYWNSHQGDPYAPVGEVEFCQVRKRHFLSHLYIKINILPRQARDKHRENSKKVPFSLRASRRRATAARTEPLARSPGHGYAGESRAHSMI